MSTATRRKPTTSSTQRVADPVVGPGRFAVVTTSQARTHLKAILDGAAEGRITTIERANTTQRAAVVDADRLRRALEHLVAVAPVVVFEEGEWAAFLPGLPISAGGATLDDAVADLIVALREYAEDWHARLRLAPNHEGNWGLVQLVELSDDDQLARWLTRAAA